MSPKAVSRTTRKRSPPSAFELRFTAAVIENAARPRDPSERGPPRPLDSPRAHRAALAISRGAIRILPTVSSHHQNAARAHRVNHFEVRIAVADDPGIGEVESVFARRKFEQSRIRFAAFAGVFVCAGKNKWRRSTRPSGKLRNHFLVDLMDKGFRKNVSRNSGLIRDHNDRNFASFSCRIAAAAYGKIRRRSTWLM